jgi:hypothetical protein
MAIQKILLDDTFAGWQNKSNQVAQEQGDLVRLSDRGIDLLYRRGSGLTINVLTLSSTSVATSSIGSGGTGYKKYDLVEIENANLNKAIFRVNTVNGSGVVSSVTMISTETGFSVATYPAKTTIVNEINKLEESKLYRGGDTMTGALDIAANLTVSAGTATISGLITANGGLTVADGTTSTFNGPVNLGNAIGDTVTVASGAWTFSNATTIAVGSTINFDSNTLVIDGTNNRIGINKAVPTVPLDVVGDTLLTTGSNVLSLTSASGLGITGNVTTSGINTLNNVTDSSSSITGAVIIAGGVGIAKKLYVGTNLTVTTDTTSPIVQGSIAASGTLTLRSTSSSTKATAGILMTDGIASTTTATGTLVVTGGVGISGATWIGGLINVAGAGSIGGTLGVTGATTLSSTLGVTGDVAVNTNKFNITAASGNTTIAGTLGVTGDVAVNTNKFNITATTGAFNAAGNATLQGTLGVSLATTLSSTLDVTGNVNVNTNKFNIVAASGNTTIAGTLGVTLATTLSSTLAVTGNVDINTNKFNIVAASGNTTIAGTLGVTGNITLSGTGNSVGTITSGIWNGTAISSQYGGTGQNYSASSGYLKYTTGTSALITSIPSADIASTLSSKTLTACTVATSFTVPTTVKLTLIDAPVSNTDAANKEYVDVKTGGFQVKLTVKGATVTALLATYNNGAGTLTANSNGVLPTIDGVSYSVLDRILVKDQNGGATSPPSDLANGIYFVSDVGSGGTPWILTRAYDADTNAELNNALVSVNAGTLYGGNSYLNSASPVVLGTTLLKWEVAGTNVNAGNGLVKSGSSIDVVGTANRIVVSADAIDVGTDVVVLGGAQTITGDKTFTGQLNLANNTTFGQVTKRTGSITTTDTTEVPVDAFAAATYGSAEYVIKATSGTDVHITKISIVKDGNATPNVFISEYGTVSSTPLFTIAGGYDGSTNVQVLVTPASATSTTFKFSAELLAI